jgi:glyoxylate/hydroxypyruvate reductase A
MTVGRRESSEWARSLANSLPVFPNLKAMFSRSAGVESFVNHPKLPNAPLCKIEPPGGDPMMTE